jgi:putative SOS response-associated peptidase YedK
VATSPAYAPSFARRRCLVPADGWFEWIRAGGVRQAHYLTPRDGSLLALAGLWSVWGPPDAPVLTCTVLTTAARGELARVHDRMPVPVPARHWAQWLEGPFDPEAVPALATDEMISGMEIRRVGAAVGNVRNNGPALLEPAPEQGQESDTLTLF